MINSKNTIFVTCTKSNDDLRFVESNMQAKALEISCVNIHEKSLEEIEIELKPYENIIYYPHEIICYGGIPNKFEIESYECLMLILRLKKNLIVYNDTIFKLKKSDIKNISKKLNEHMETGTIKMMSQSEFSTVNSRMFQKVEKVKLIPFMNLLYSCNNYKTREEELKEFVFSGDASFFVQGRVGKIVPKDSLINIITTAKISYSEFLKLLNDSYSTILIKDPRWTKIGCKLPSWRFIEAWTTNCVCFITESMREFCPDMKDDFFYVADKFDLHDKIDSLIKYPEMRMEKLNHQLELLNAFDKAEYREKYFNYLNNLTTEINL